MDVMRIIKLAIENLKEDGLAIIVNGTSHILQKAMQIPVLTSNISDYDRQLIQCNQFLTGLLYHSLDFLGPAFVFGASANFLGAILDWLISS